MKRFATKLMIALTLYSSMPSASADVVHFLNNAIVCFYSDSWNADPGGLGDISGYRCEAYLHSYFVLNNPATNIAFYNWSKSGGYMDEMLTNRLQQDGLAAWGYTSNSFPLYGIVNSTDNGGGLTSNQMYLAQSNVFQAPAIMSDGALPLTAQTGWAATHPVSWISFGQPPEQTSDGDIRQKARDDASTNAGWNLGVMGIAIWTVVAQAWTNDFNANGGTNVQWLPRGGHFASGGALSWALAFLKGFTTDTNISTCTVDFNSAISVATNHCVLNSFSKVGNSLTFNRLDDRLPFAWDVPDGTITNDARGAFNLIPSDASFFRFTLQITNLPAGTYLIQIDGVTVAAQISSTELTAGWNMMTNYVGPYWNQRKEVLGRIRDLEYVDRVTLTPGNSGDGIGLQGLGNTLHNAWVAGHRGDQLIADGHAAISHLYTNSTASFAAIHSAAQPTNHTFTVSLITPRFAPYHK